MLVESPEPCGFDQPNGIAKKKRAAPTLRCERLISGDGALSGLEREQPACK